MSIRGTLFIFITGFVFFQSLRKPKVGLIYFLLLLFLRDGVLMEFIPEIYANWHLPLITSIVVLLCWLGNKLSNAETAFTPPEIIAMLLLAVIVFAGRFYAQYPGFSEYMFDEYIRMVALVFLISNIIKTEADLKQIIMAIVILTSLLALRAYFRYKTEYLEYAVPSLYYVDRNYFAESLVAVVPMAYMFFETSKKVIMKPVFLAITALLSAVVILTYSRGGLLALFIVVALLFLRSRRKAMMIGVCLLLAVVFLPHIGAKYFNRMDTITDYKEDNSAMVRLATWSSGLAMLKAHPLSGVGAGNFNNMFISYTPETLKQYATYTMSIHNMFLQVFSETGAIGGASFLFFIGWSFLGISRLNRRNNMLPQGKRLDLTTPNLLSISIIGFCGAGFFLPGAYYGYLYIIIPLLIASRRIYMDKIEAIAKT